MRSSPLFHNMMKWRETMIIGFSKIATYRFNFILTVLAPSLVAFFIKYYLWTSLYEGHPSGEINGYGLNEMISYHIWALIVATLSQGHTSIDLAIEIRHGKISTYLIYPFNFWEFHTASFFSFQIIQTLIALLTVGLLCAMGIIAFPSLSSFFMGLSHCLVVSLFWFSVQFLIGILAFWLEETWMLRILLQIVATFLSGFIIPLDFFPSWLQATLNYTPFPFLTFYPVKMFLGHAPDTFGVSWVQGIGILGLWIALTLMATILIWRKSVKLYTAAGM